MHMENDNMFVYFPYIHVLRTSLNDHTAVQRGKTAHKFCISALPYVNGHISSTRVPPAAAEGGDESVFTALI